MLERTRERVSLKILQNKIYIYLGKTKEDKEEIYKFKDYEKDSHIWLHNLYAGHLLTYWKCLSNCFQRNLSQIEIHS